MSVNVRIIEGGIGEITQEYKGSAHAGIDIVNKNYTLGNIVAHSDGIVVGTRNNCTGFESGSYGNYVKIKHDNGYYTLYAHGSYNTVKVSVGDRVKKGQVLFYMGNTGYSFGGHVHFEVRDKNDNKINPTNYINDDLPNEVNTTHKYNIGDNVKINGVYSSSMSYDKLNPNIDHGMITNIKEGSLNPYLLNEGYIGWVNDSVIEGLYVPDEFLILVKKTIRGDYGNGEVRKQKLGINYEKVQRQVNLNYQNGTTSWDNIRIY